jgi:hypothetical protein
MVSFGMGRKLTAIGVQLSAVSNQPSVNSCQTLSTPGAKIFHFSHFSKNTKSQYSLPVCQGNGMTAQNRQHEELIVTSRACRTPTTQNQELTTDG